jgi:CRISPR-associated exonuclease Cas4
LRGKRFCRDTSMISPMAKAPVRFISAGDLEKYSYCPLSWWQSSEHEGEGEELVKGIRAHERLGKSLWKIDASETAASQSERLVFWWAVVATIIAIIGLEVLPFKRATEMSEVLGVVALIWILAASYFLFKATKSKIQSSTVNYERIIIVFAIIAIIIAGNAVAFSVTNVKLAVALEAVAIAWLIGASFFMYKTLRSTTIVDSLRKEYRVKGKIEYIDMAGAKAFRSEKYGLIGRPDYVIKLEDKIIPVEEKKGRTPQGPLFSHILQIAAYCLLIEEETGKTPPYGLLKYPEHEHEIEYNEDLKKVLLQKLDEMREAMRSGKAHRNHNRPGKCANCSRKDSCPEKLV